MSKLNELFVETINKAIESADVMTDMEKKPVAYASIAQALAIYLTKDQSESYNNLTPEWSLPYDNNGVPYLNEEDFNDPEKVLQYNKALESIKNNSEEHKENVEQENKQEVKQEVKQETSSNDELLAKIEKYKELFNYEEDPSILDGLYSSFTNEIHGSLAEATPQTLEAFDLFIEDELVKAKKSLAEWENSWIGKEGLNNLIAEVYQDPNATIETHINCSNIFQFLNYVSLYNANAWLQSYKSDLSEDVLNNYVREYLEDNNTTIENIDDSNVIGFIYFIQEKVQETA